MSEADVIQQAEALKNQANKLFEDRKYKDAVELYTKAIDLKPDNAVLYANRAFAHIKMENFGYHYVVHKIH
jgi:serine/threonine-protein phosphatase 5